MTMNNTQYMARSIDMGKSIKLAFAAVCVLAMLYMAMRLPASTHIQVRQVQAWPDSSWNFKW